ncbi:MAG: two-component system sensor histidine kinase BaeS [Cryomorphaceae bacterium]|jgi:two-component system sensor histidine kinase BaeS
MKSISTKLFLALVGLTTLVLVATLLLARWSFEQGFLDYVRAQEERRLISLAADLASHYVANDSAWGEDSPQIFEQILDKWHPRGRRLSARPRSRDELRRPPPRADKQSNFRRSPPPRRGDNGRKGGPPHKEHHTNLVDSQGRHIAGPQQLPIGLHVVKVPILINGETVAELKAVVQINTDASLETEFSEQQTRASILIAVMSLLIAGLASWWLVRMLLAPLIKMKDGVAYLARGDYSNRLDSERNDELGALMVDIDQLALKLEQNRSSRKRWLADISHELRTPVTILAGEIEAIKDGLRPLDINQVESLGHEVDCLRHLINDLYELSLSDIGGLRYEHQLVNIAEVLESLVLQNRARINEAGVELILHCEGSALISADLNRLEQLFTNVINNSLAYTDRPGKMLISLKIDDDSALIAFEDSAPSVDKAAMKEMFEPLYRQDSSRSRRVAGAGLGLTICRNIVQAHRGEITACKSPLGGVCIRIEFPLDKSL